MDNAASKLWLKRCLYVLLSFLVLFLHLLPLDTKPDRWPFPDILIVLTYAWLLRRPEYVPMISIAAIMLLADLLLQRPPGLMAALVVLGAAYLRSAAPGFRDAGFAAEWTSVAAVITVIFVANGLILGILSVQQAGMGSIAIQAIVTISIYPAIVLLSQVAFGVTRASVTDNTTAGARA
ncbi:rod shape-determining protein MreD [Ruegeria arenilitoris]|uniref:rod shape-determining protein MreD n=1 Tax=Ruegeria arenilitoris TaxID=1173585 RepID=UPI00147D779D|nr:rod shape-determining protein MreD [Ruegeria arenilitoris]